jgi:acetyl/propionyl-CoA carboxylase alpha subunit
MENRKINKILVANRAVPAVRILHTCRDRKIKTVAVYSTPDRLAQHVIMADAAVQIGEAPPRDSYLNIERIVNAALESGADAIHPGWGFLSENEGFAAAVIDAGLVWIGPSPEVIRAMGDKRKAKQIAEEAGIPLIPGINDESNPEAIKAWMKREDIAYPLMIKSSAGGGGKGMLKVENDEQIQPALDQVRSEGMKYFGDDAILIEKYIERGRHLEVQIVADMHGNILHLFERECTIQRRNQKIIEEAPAPTLDDQLRQQLYAAAIRLMKNINYTSAGTVEFLFDSKTRRFYFLEVNTRLQVEHGTTELLTGLDIVAMMIDIAMGKPLTVTQTQVHPNRWALEARLNAEDPVTFSPSYGHLTRLFSPQGPAVRISPGYYEGAEIPPYYDSLIMLIKATGADREGAIRVLDRSISKNLRVEGVKTLAPLLLSIIRHPKFISGEYSTRFIEENMEELVSMFKEKDSEDELRKIARYVAEVTALGTPKWI